MSQSFDVILKSGTVVNQDGEGVRDIAIRDGRIAAIGSLAQAAAADDGDVAHTLPVLIDDRAGFQKDIKMLGHRSSEPALPKPTVRALFPVP